MRCRVLPASSYDELASIQCGVWRAHCSSWRIWVPGKRSSNTKARSRTCERSAVSGAAVSTVTAGAIEDLLVHATGEVLDGQRERHHVRVLLHSLQLCLGSVFDLRCEPVEGVPDRVYVG